MKPKRMMILAAALLCVAGLSAAENPIDLAMASWGGQSEFDDLGVLRFDVSEHDTLPDGSSRTTSYTLYLDPLAEFSRMDIPDGKIVVVSNRGEGWATVAGKLDDRPQTKILAPGMINMKMFPALLPFSVAFDGVSASSQTVATTFEGRPVVATSVRMIDGFFNSPLVNNQWTLYLAKGDHHLVGAEFLPTPGFEAANTPGMRFHVSQTTDLDGVTFATRIDIDNVDASGKKMGGRRVMTINPSIVDSPSPLLFMNPEKVKELEEN